MEHISLNKLIDRGTIGLEISHTTETGVNEMLGNLIPHKDDNYLFFFIEKGFGTMMVDFTEVRLTQGNIYYLLPGQVHHRIRSDNGEAWFMAVDPSLIPKEYREVFANQLLRQQPNLVDSNYFQQFQSIIRLLYEQFQSASGDKFYLSLTQSLLSSFLGMTARVFIQIQPAPKSLSRSFQITQEFRKLVTEKVKTEKHPSVYADHLYISESYLNEVVKKETGFTVTYWINLEVMLEAKRLLYYTQLTVKEISYQLGYDDHTYFSKLFKKNTRITPLAFRGMYRK